MTGETTGGQQKSSISFSRDHEWPCDAIAIPFYDFLFFCSVWIICCCLECYFFESFGICLFIVLHSIYMFAWSFGHCLFDFVFVSCVLSLNLFVYTHLLLTCQKHSVFINKYSVKENKNLVSKKRQLITLIYCHVSTPKQCPAMLHTAQPPDMTTRNYVSY